MRFSHDPKRYGQTPGQIHREIKLEKAKELITSTNLSVNEIGERLGYTSSSYFMKQFRSKYEKTPLKYRKQHQQIGLKPVDLDPY
ncbi:helix-turn-helix domain-containing protein [Sporolactobacillus sp. KGMB 08714]|uniref:helix-turn-helix domain-containing protein n=1 Tax=unclassified Sporolactobacillus TaxID=2628533 RepID=UPI003FA69ECE